MRRLDLTHRLRRFLRSRGVEVLLTSRATLLPLHLTQLFAQEGTEHVLDVGAQVGGYAMMLRRLGYAGEISSFEPVTASYKVLAKRAAADSRWEAFNVALGARPGRGTINVAHGSDFSSFLSPTPMALAAPHLRAASVAATEEVIVETLDEMFVRETAWSGRRTHLKLDTQGFDLEVLKGGTNLMPCVSSLQTEVSLQAVYHDMPALSESLDALEDLGFSVTGFFPVAVNPDLSVVELDCVAVRRR